MIAGFFFVELGLVNTALFIDSLLAFAHCTCTCTLLFVPDNHGLTIVGRFDRN